RETIQRIAASVRILEQIMNLLTSSQERSFLARALGSQAPIGLPNSGTGSRRNAGKRPLTRLGRRLRENELFTSLMLRGFRALQRMGINVTPNHFYWPIPDIAELERREWPSRVATVSFDFHVGQQLELLRTLTAKYQTEWSFREGPINDSAAYHYNNGFFET